MAELIYLFDFAISFLTLLLLGFFIYTIWEIRFLTLGFKKVWTFILIGTIVYFTIIIIRLFILIFSDTKTELIIEHIFFPLASLSALILVIIGSYELYGQFRHVWKRKTISKVNTPGSKVNTPRPHIQPYFDS